MQIEDMKNAGILNSIHWRLLELGLKEGLTSDVFMSDWMSVIIFFGTDYTPSTCRIRFYSIKKTNVLTTELINYTTSEEIQFLSEI